MRSTLVCPLLCSLSVGVTMQIGSRYDTPRRDNLDANGTIAREAIGASIAPITP